MNHMRFQRSVAYFCFGLAAGQFAMGIYKFDAFRLSIAFIFLGIAWLYREMNLGWDSDKKSFKFIPWRTQPTANPNEHESR